ncbi:MAG: L,D-transpeptidase [Bacillota bacterium]
MSYLQDPRPHHSAQAIWRRREARRRKYLRRRIVALVVLLLLVGGLAYGGYTLLTRWQQAPDPDPVPTPSAEQADASKAPPPSGPLPFTADYYLNAADLDGDGQVERVAISKAEGAMRTVALVSGSAGKERIIGAALRLPDFPLALQDFPGAERILVWSGELPRRGAQRQVSVGGAQATEAAGGEPDRKGWRLDPVQGLVPVDYYTLAAPETPPEPTVILVDKGLNVLWYYEESKLVQTARVSTGLHLDGPAPTKANQQENFLTPTGRFSVSLRAPGMPYYKEKIPALDPRNPLGTRWLGFAAFEGDKGNLWAVRGTNDPSRVGQWVSEGSVELRNEEMEQLYDRVKLGTPVIIINSLSQ